MVDRRIERNVDEVELGERPPNVGILARIEIVVDCGLHDTFQLVFPPFREARLVQDQGDHFPFRFVIKTSVDVHFVFDVREGSIEGIGGVRNVEFGKFLARKKIRQPVCCCFVCRANIAVRVLPSSCLSGDCFLCKKYFIFFMPCVECFGERLFVHPLRIECEKAQRSTGLGLRFFCEMACHGLREMELTELHRKPKSLYLLS